MTNFGLATYAAIAEKIQAVDFDAPFVLTATGDVIENAESVWAPEIVYGVYALSSTLDIEVESNWEAVTQGLSLQYGYGGAVMHPSESVGGRIAERLMDIVELHDDADQVFAIVSVESPDDDDDEPVGWTIVRYTGQAA